MIRMALSRLTPRASFLMTAAVVLTLLLNATPLRAQVDTGTILGTVTDTSGAAVRGANVTMINEGTNATLAPTTGSNGEYKFTPVKIGSYRLSASYQGFQTIAQKNVTVNVGENVVADFVLKPGNITET